MTFPTFKHYLSLTEDAAAELAQLGMQRQQLVMKKATTDRQIDTQIAALDKMIYQKEQQKEIEDKKNGVKPDPNNQRQNPNQQQQQPQGNRTVQPGSSGSQTPGSAAPQQQGM